MAKKSKEKKEKKTRKPTSPETKATLIKSITAVVCAAAVSVTGNAVAGKICDAKVELVRSSAAAGSYGCLPGNSDGGSNTSGAVLPDESTADSGFSVPAADTAASAPDSSGPESGAPVPAAAEKETGTRVPGEKTVAEIVAAYNTAANKIKPSAKSITRNYNKMQNLPEYLELPSAISSIGEWAINKFVKGSDDPAVFDEKEEIDEYFPISHENYTSKLTADMVKNATLKDEGGVLKIDIVLKDDSITSPKKGTGYAGVFNTVSASTFEEISIPGTTFESVKINGINGRIQCTIDKKTQLITKLNLKNTDVLDLDVKVAGSRFKVKTAFSNENDYTVNY